MNKTLSVLFFIKRTKLLRNGEAPIYVRLTIDGEIVEFGSKQSIKLESWDSRKNRARGKAEKNKAINTILTRMELRLLEIYSRESEKIDVTPANLKMLFFGKNDNPKTIVELIENHNTKMSELVGSQYSLSTLGKFKTTLKHIKEYNNRICGKEDLKLSRLDYKYIENFEHYLKTIVKCQQNSATKHLKALKKIINQAVLSEEMNSNPFKNYKLKHEVITREFLSMEEVQKIENADIAADSTLDEVRKMFLFQCYTGLSFLDLQNLTTEHVVKGDDGYLWIKGKRKKTGTTYQIPLIEKAITLLNSMKHKHSNRLAFKISNQKMNMYLKQLAIQSNVTKNLVSHIGRHTFATTITLTNGIPLETVSKVLGHKKILTTQIYAKVLDSKISKDFSELRKL